MRVNKVVLILLIKLIHSQKQKKKSGHIYTFIKKRKEKRSELCYSVMLRPTIDGKHTQ